MTPPGAVVLREFEWEDYDAALAIWREAFGGLKPEDEREPLRRTIERNPGLFMVAVLDGRVVGTAIGTTDGRRAFLYHVAVSASARRRGVATALVRAVASRTWAAGTGVIHLRVEGSNAAAIAFYERLGFTRDPPVMGMRLTRGSITA
jgi:ribosomal protein S18 acetylase RimI-like enzyme